MDAEERAGKAPPPVEEELSQLVVEMSGEAEAFDVSGKPWPGPAGPDIVLCQQAPLPRARLPQPRLAQPRLLTTAAATTMPPPAPAPDRGPSAVPPAAATNLADLVASGGGGRGPGAVPEQARPSRAAAMADRLRGPAQVGFTLALLLSLPFIAYVLALFAGFDLTTVTYPLVAAALAATVVALWAEDLLATKRTNPVTALAADYPPATAIIAADLSEDAGTVADTVSNMLGQGYPGKLQVVLAFNPTGPLFMEEILAQMAARDSRLELLPVPGRNSRSHNIMLALPQARGEVVGLFQAGNDPEPGSFARAWGWLSQGYDLVQGHLVVSNGKTSWVARLLAVEFERTYTVEAPGRERLYGFGVPGGPSTYWRRDALAALKTGPLATGPEGRWAVSGLPADLRVRTDPGLVSTVVAPTTMGGLWRQRLTWAQRRPPAGRQHHRPAPDAGPPNRWRQLAARSVGICSAVAPWLTAQAVPLLAFAAWRHRGLGGVTSLAPLLLGLGALVLTVGVAQPLFAYRLGDGRIRSHRSWFFLYALHSVLWFGELKHIVARVAQLGLAGRPQGHGAAFATEGGEPET